MFLDVRDTPAPPPWQPSEPAARAPRLTARQRRVMSGIVAVNLFLLLVAPIGGATVLAAIALLWR